MNELDLHTEALIFASDHPITLTEIEEIIRLSLQIELSSQDIIDSTKRIEEKYNHPSFAIKLVHTGGGYQFLTDSLYYKVIEQLQIQRSKKKLSQAALETLAIIAYKQPVTKLEIEQIRGVNCDYTIQKLLEKELISIGGKSETPGRPLLYTSSPLFMDYFGLNSVSELPHMRDVTANSNEIGEENR